MAPSTSLRSISVAGCGDGSRIVSLAASGRAELAACAERLPRDHTRQRGLRCEHWAHQVGTAAAALAAFEIAVGGGGAALAGLEDVRVHAEAHGTARFAPFEASFAEDLVEPLILGLRAYEARA